jgi:hypothetical protein
LEFLLVGATAKGPCVLEILGIENGSLVLEEGYASVMQIYREKLLGD